jgi:hypothetical protein
MPLANTWEDWTKDDAVNLGPQAAVSPLRGSSFLAEVELFELLQVLGGERRRGAALPLRLGIR